MSRNFWSVLCIVALVFGGFGAWQKSLAAREARFFAPAKLLPVHPLPIPADAQTAVFAGGCFWGVEETFRLVPGVVDTQAGYTGGTSPRPTYRTVHSDTTGHVEAVRVVFDPAKVTYGDLLAVFFAHRSVSTTGPKRARIGSAYRDFVFTQNAAQAVAAQRTVQTLRKKEAISSNDKTAVRRTTVGIAPVGAFWPAEEEHQRYYEKRGGEGAGAACRL